MVGKIDTINLAQQPSVPNVVINKRDQYRFGTWHVAIDLVNASFSSYQKEGTKTVHTHM